MNFLEARKILQGFSSDNKLPFLLAMSGTSDQMLPYVKAFAAQDGIDAQPRSLPFGTLSQATFEPSKSGEGEIFVLFPWDFIPELDWRSGVPQTVAEIGELFEQARSLADRLRARPNAKILYVPAPALPIYASTDDTQNLLNSVLGLAHGLGATILPPSVFTLGGHLASGSPIRGDRLHEVAKTIWNVASRIAPHEFKVLVTDFDGVMWSGVIGEDGLDGIECGPAGRGYSNFIYQSLLKSLKARGVILAAVSRNDMELALSPFKTAQLQLDQDDFVAILASYEDKSSQIALLAEKLNLGLDSFVFVDDNPIEIAEVSSALPQVCCLQFPKADDDMVELINRISTLFNRATITDEDRVKTDMYRRRMKATPPREAKGADIENFLRGLGMRLNFVERTAGDWDRALQLINKTNQFNLNGRRVSEEELAEKLGSGARLFCGGLSDRTGNHGEVIACLIETDGRVSSFIMSCRVFQRRLEHAFVVAVLDVMNIDLQFDFIATKRNTPAERFLDDPAFTVLNDGQRVINANAFIKDHQADRELFDTGEPNVD